MSAGASALDTLAPWDHHQWRKEKLLRRLLTGVVVHGGCLDVGPSKPVEPLKEELRAD